MISPVAQSRCSNLWRFVNVILWMTLSINIAAQPNQSRFTQISIEHGLSQSSVFDITQDRDGFMWFATGDGLNRYDGYEFKVYRHDPYDTTTISDLGIRHVFTDQKGELWIITLRGNLDRYDPVADCFIHYDLPMPANSADHDVSAISLSETPDGNLWVGASNGYLYRFYREIDTFYLYPISAKNAELIQGIHLQCLHADRHGIIWIGTWEGLFRLSPEENQLTHFPRDGDGVSGPAGNLIFDITEDNAGQMWIATADGGLSVYHPEQGTFEAFKNDPENPHSISSNRLMCVLPDNGSNLWIGTVDAGLNRCQSYSHSFTRFTHDPASLRSLGNGGIYSLFEDKSGGIWIGTSGGGVNRYDARQQQFQNYEHRASDPTSLSQNTVLAIMEDYTDALWVGTDGGGLNCLAPGQSGFQHFLRNSSLVSSNSIIALFEDSYGTIWVSADPGFQASTGSILTWDRGTGVFHPFQKIPLNIGSVVAIYEDRERTIWLGTTTNGLYRYNPSDQSVVSFKHSDTSPNSISANFILDIFQDSHGNMWFGTLGGGLNRLDMETMQFSVFRNEPTDSTSISNNTVWCLYEDNSGDLWMGTWGGGLVGYREDTNRFKSFTLDDGLPSNVVYEILPDDSGNLWLSTNLGLCRFNPVSLECRNYDYSDGLPGSEFNQGAAYKLHDGRLAFGGTSGMTIFHPDSITDNPYIPPVRITKFKIFDEPIPLERTANSMSRVSLSYQQNFFSFEFAALDYTTPLKNQFKYLLEGVDKHWIEAGNRNFASYTNIPPGDYLFRLIGSNSDGIWNRKETSVAIHINPPFWQTWWFRISAAGLAILLLTSIYRYRVNKLLEVERTRVRIAQDLHDEVSGTLTGISYFANAISKEVGANKNDILRKLLSLIQESTTQVQESMSDIIWSINPENDNWETLLPKFNRYTADMCENNGIEYHGDFPAIPEKRTLPMDVRRHLWLIFKEMVTNAVKHSGCTELRITMQFDRDHFRFTVADNGHGFNPDHPGEGNGIKNIRNRAQSLNAEIHFRTDPDLGTVWDFSLNL